jgi:hypothetical protein
MHKKPSVGTSACWFAVFAALTILPAGCASNGAVATSSPLEADPPRAFLQAVIDRLPTATARREMAAAPPEEFYLWGNEICAQLKGGQPARSITADLAHFFGTPLAAALVDSAKETICPDFRSLV